MGYSFLGHTVGVRIKGDKWKYQNSSCLTGQRSPTPGAMVRGMLGADPHSRRWVVGEWAKLRLYLQLLQVALVVKNPPDSAEDIREAGSIPGSGRSPGGGHGNPLQYSCPENPTDRGAWRAIVHGVTKSRTWLKRLSMHPSLRLLCELRLLSDQLGH